MGIIAELRNEIKTYGSISCTVPTSTKTKDTAYDKTYSAKKPENCKEPVEWCLNCERKDCNYKGM